MNAITAIRPAPTALETAQAKADAWTADAAPVIATYLRLGALLDEVERNVRFFGKPTPAQDAINEAYLEIEAAQMNLKARLDDLRGDAIDRAHPLDGCSIEQLEADDGAGLDLMDTLMADTTSVDDAIRAAERAI